MTRKTLFAAIAGCAMLGLSAQAAPAFADTVLNLVVADYGTGPADTSQKYWQGIADDFHAVNPSITVKVQTINWNDFDTKVQTMVQNHQYPDITEGDYFSSYAQEGLLYKVSDVFSNPGNLMGVFNQLGMYDNVQYGMPFTTSSRALFYNKKIFAEAGITTPPQTWDDVLADSVKIKAAGKIGFGLPLGPEEAQAESLLWFLGNGGGYQDNAGKWVIDSPQNVETLQFLTKLVNAGGTEPNPGTKNRTDLFAQFAQGKIGMMNGLPALLPIVKQAGVVAASDVGTTPIAGKAGPLDKTLGVCDLVAAFKTDGTKQEAIKKFLDFAYQDKYQIEFVNMYNELPGTNSAAAALAASDATLAPFLKPLENAVQYSPDPVWAQVKTQIQQSIGTATTGDPEKVLKAIQQTAEGAD